MSSPERRYFKVTGYAELIENGRIDAENEFKIRKSFLDEWGSRQVCMDHEENIIGLDDPRQFDEPKPLGKGWKKGGNKSRLVFPTTPETKAIVKSLNLNSFGELREAVLTALKAANPTLADMHGKAHWWSNHTNGKIYGNYLLPSDLEEFGVFMSTVDSKITLDGVEGIEPVEEWEFKKAISDKRKARVAEQTEVTE